MSPLPSLSKLLRANTASCERLLARLADLYGMIDKAYRQTAAFYDFHCDGCAENCCRTHFYHHTVIEYAFLCKGLGDLTPHIRQAVLAAAGARADMCPLNLEGCCALYAVRPMICRMHGIAHQLCKPDGTCVTGPGCAEFERRRQTTAPVLDRTPFYKQMAALEGEARQVLGYREKIKMTVAEMLVSFVQSGLCDPHKRGILF